jgi:hypothetical protein
MFIASARNFEERQIARKERVFPQEVIMERSVARKRKHQQIAKRYAESTCGKYRKF